ncbi:hypothetical protein V8C86DRAFT_2991889, partial [Haematococcus lacustris]
MGEGTAPCCLLLYAATALLAITKPCYTCHAPAIDSGSPGCRSKRLLLAAFASALGYCSWLLLME